jgi:adenylate cyclase
MFLAALFADEEASRELVDQLYAMYPERPETLHWGAHAELVLGRRDRALALLETAESVGIVDGDVEYDLACLAAMDGNVDAAIDHLERAVELGYRMWDWIEKDTDLAKVRSHPRYAEFMARHR